VNGEPETDTCWWGTVDQLKRPGIGWILPRDDSRLRRVVAMLRQTQPLWSELHQELTALAEARQPFDTVTPDDPARAVVEGLRAVRGSREVDVVHGTTVGLNAVLTGSLARTALVTNAGFRDLCEIGRQDRIGLYELQPRRTEFPVPRSLRFELPVRHAADGSTLQRLRADDVDALAERLRRARVGAVAVALLHSYRDNGDEHDNNALIPEILALRNERVQLLGYDNYAQWRLENRMAKTPENAFGLMETVWPAAVARVKEEVADMQAIADAEGAGIEIEPWDYRYYAEKVRKAKYDFDSEELKQYLQLDNLREAMFFVAGEIFNFAFTPVAEGSVPVFHEDVRVWEVTDKDTGAHIGLWYLDPYARRGKRSGAWATTYRTHENIDGEITVLGSNNSNFIKGAPGEPVLISWDDATTLFHEFGHALHYLSSTVDYPTLNGGVRDFTEFQSQLLERWLLTDEVIDTYLVHVETGEPMPEELVAKIKKAATFNQGFSTTEYLACAILDMKYHTMDPAGLDVDTFERTMLAEMNMPDEIVMRHRSPHFGHIFSSESYAAGYYGYMWADVLTADAAEAFRDAPGGFYDKELARSLVDNLFAVRNSVDPADAYRAFRGRDAEVGALMRDRGFPMPGK